MSAKITKFCVSRFTLRAFVEFAKGLYFMKLGVFIPIGNNGWLISENSPQYMPSFKLNRKIVQKAEELNFSFALSMIKLHGFGGKTEYWDHNLESFTLMAGLASVTKKIELFATCPVLAIPPAITARMAMTIHDISEGRFGINIISGWQRREYEQMGLWPGAEYYKRRYDYCGEYVTVLKELWETGHTNFQGDFFKMDECKCSPLPQSPIPIICAAQSDAGTQYAARYADYNFCASFGVNKPKAVSQSVGRLIDATENTERKCGALILTMIIADTTDEAAFAKWEYYKAGTDAEALAYRDRQASDDPSQDKYNIANRRKIENMEKLPTNQGLLIGSFENVAKMLNELSTVNGVEGVMLTFDDFILGLEQFGEKIQPHLAF